MKIWTPILLAVLVAAGVIVQTRAEDKETKKVDNRVFELRTYYALPGRMDALHARFRDHTCKLFEKNGITIVGFWSPTDPEESQKKLVYMLAYPNMEEAKKRWNAFLKDPEWIAAKKESESSGKIVDRVESVFLNPTDYSTMK